MGKKIVAIVDYTLGNLFSVQRALEIVGTESKITDNKQDLLDADKVILPVVGAFEKGMEGLKEKDLVNTIKDLVDYSRGRPGVDGDGIGGQGELLVYMLITIKTTVQILLSTKFYPEKMCKVF